jgi:site-specific DNA-adenine methylase
MEKELHEVDHDLIWEAIWGGRENLLQLYTLLHNEIDEITLMLYNHESSDELFKKQLSDTHKKYYEQLEILFKVIKNTPRKRRANNESSLENIYKSGGEG